MQSDMVIWYIKAYKYSRKKEKKKKITVLAENCGKPYTVYHKHMLSYGWATANTSTEIYSV